MPHQTRSPHDSANPVNPNSQPQEFATRGFDNSILQQLLGREGSPTLPPIQQVSTPELLQQMHTAERSGDRKRVGNLRRMIELRSNPLTTADPARGLTPQQDTSTSPGVLLNPFRLFERPQFLQ